MQESAWERCLPCLKEQQLALGFSDGINKFVRITGNWKQLLLKARSHFFFLFPAFTFPFRESQRNLLSWRYGFTPRKGTLASGTIPRSYNPTTHQYPGACSFESRSRGGEVRAVIQSRACIIGYAETSLKSGRFGPSPFVLNISIILKSITLQTHEAGIPLHTTKTLIDLAPLANHGWKSPPAYMFAFYFGYQRLARCTQDAVSSKISKTYYSFLGFCHTWGLKRALCVLVAKMLRTFWSFDVSLGIQR